MIIRQVFFSQPFQKNSTAFIQKNSAPQIAFKRDEGDRFYLTEQQEGEDSFVVRMALDPQSKAIRRLLEYADRRGMDPDDLDLALFERKRDYAVYDETDDDIVHYPGLDDEDNVIKDVDEAENYNNNYNSNLVDDSNEDSDCDDDYDCDYYDLDDY